MNDNTIILLEDDVQLRDLYKIILEDEGYNLICSENSSDIIQLINEHSPVLVITDMIMPESDGTEGILKILNYIEIPILVISAHADMLKAAKSLVTSCLLKPIKAEALVSTVKQILNK